jgi:hypothetical protein
MLETQASKTDLPSGSKLQDCLPPNAFLLKPYHAHRQLGTLQIISAKQILLCLALVGLISFFGLIIMQGAQPLILDYQLQQNGIDTQGSIVDIQPVSMRSRGQAPAAYITYSFTSAAEVIYLGKQVVSTEDSRRLQPGATVAIRYLLHNPNASVLVVQNVENILGPGNAMITLLVTISQLATLAVFASLMWSVWWDEQYFRRGRLIFGHVLKCRAYLESFASQLNVESTDRHLGGRFMIELSYAFHSHAGKTIRAVTTQQRNDLRFQALPAFGQPLAILYLDDRHYKLL